MSAPSDREISRAVTRAVAGKTIDAREAAGLLSARGDELRRLMSAAARVRDAGLESAGRPGVVTYSKKVFIPLTRLCRDRCHYCTFATTPGRLPAPFLSPDEVLDIARKGAAMGCKEALFTLGDRPEDRWDDAKEWLEAAGYDSTLEYVRAMAIRVLEETGLLPHLNPGVMSWKEMSRLKPVAPSMGMMLETTSRRLFEEKGEAHYASPDKDPAVRLRVLEDAGRLNIPFTTGLLIGIGETIDDRVESIFELRRIARTYGSIQEVIIQNFVSKDDTAMRLTPDLEVEEYLAAIATTRILMGPAMRVQAPPNLVGLDDCRALLDAGVDDFGGISPLTPDHVNPEKPWPQITALTELCAERGFALTERLTAHPQFLSEPWLDPRLRPHVDALVADDGLARADAIPEGLPWQEPDGGWSTTGWLSRGRTDLHTEIDTIGRTDDRRSDFEDVYGDWSVLRDEPAGPRCRAGRHRRRRVRRGDAGGRARSVRPVGRGRADAHDGRGRAPRRRRRTGRRPAPAGGRRRGHLHRQPQHQLHQRLLHRLPLLRVRPAAYRRRCLHAVAGRDRRPGQRGSGVRGDRGLHAGRHRSRAARHGVLRHRRGGQEPRARPARPRVQPHGGHERGDAHRHVGARLPGAGQGVRRRLAARAPPRRSSTTTCAGS